MLDLVLKIIVCAFATFRLAEMITIDLGPGMIFFHLRERAGAYDIADNLESRHELGKLISCPYCLGIYISFVFAMIIDWTITLPITLFAIAGIQSFLQSGWGRK